VRDAGGPVSEGEAWWSAWLVGGLGASAGSVYTGAGAGGPSVGALMQEERAEERFGRSWGGRLGVGVGMEGWAV
jgi:hypothetical protein